MKKCVILFLLPVLSTFGAGQPFQVSRLENDILQVQTTNVNGTFPRDLALAAATNQVSGLVLDLRFAGGGTAVSTQKLLLPPKLPVIVLVNAQTRGAAAELAAQLRVESRAILIGGTNVTGKIAPDITVTATSEQEKKFQENPYTAAEKPVATAGNRDLLPFIDHTSEAELVRRRVKDGDDNAAEAPRSAPEQPVIRDPALARAVDLLKALAVLGKARG